MSGFGSIGRTSPSIPLLACWPSGSTADSQRPQTLRSLAVAKAEASTPRDADAIDFVRVTANVAKRKPASTVSGEQSDRQLSAGASRQTGP
jgi:hypothetical protein